MSGAFVLDASSAVSWFLPDEASQSGMKSLREVEHGAIPHVGCNWHLEVTQALLGASRRKRIAPRDMESAFSLLRELSVETEPPPGQRAFQELRSLGVKHGISVYDAVYLDLALRRNLPLATGDALLAKAARKEGLAVLA